MAAISYIPAHYSPPRYETSRTRGTVDERHHIRKPDSTASLQAWENSVLKGRVSDLFLTEKNLPGHAIAIQNELNRLSVDGRDGDFVCQVVGSQRRIYDAIKKIYEGYKRSIGGRPLALTKEVKLEFPLIHQVIKIT